MIDGPHMIEEHVEHPDKPDNAWWACEMPERPFDSFVIAWDGCEWCKMHSKIDMVTRMMDKKTQAEEAYVYFLGDSWYGRDVLPKFRDAPGGPDADS